ncbi:MAG: hypothetical protein K2L07_06125 [Lachnospiraceae bacterium]|nr:hypothetical protein [Lachnospiraceae bacterium]
MNKQDNKLALSVLAALTAGIALIYTLMMYHTIIYAVAGVSVLFLITAYILTQNIITFVTMRNKSMNVQIKNMVDDLSSQLENMSSTQAQIGKATYLFTRQTAKAVTILEGNYTESQEALYRNLTVLSNTQNKATKLLIKYDLDNTRKLISTLKEIRNHLSETMVQGFDQITPNNDEVIATLQTIVDYLNSQSNEMDQTMGLQLDKVARELQNISNNIQNVQFSAQNVMPAKPVTPSAPEQATSPEQPASPEQPTQTEELPIMESVPAQEPDMELSPETFVDTLGTDDIFMDENIDEIIDSKDMEEETILTDIAETSEPENTAPVSEDPNKQLSADEISALFAAAEPTPATAEEEPVIPDIDDTAENEESFTPTFTVVGKSEEEETIQTAPATEEPTASAVTETAPPALGEDPNKQLSADEIAALFAASDPAPKREKNTEKPVEAAPADDPNKQLSADEIAALFAASDPAPKAETPAKEEPKAEPVNADPNKQLSPDEIAALFAQMG